MTASRTRSSAPAGVPPGRGPRAATWTAPRAAGRATACWRRSRTTRGTRPSSAATSPRRPPTTCSSRAGRCSAGWSAWPRPTSPSSSRRRPRWRAAHRLAAPGGHPGRLPARASTRPTWRTCAPTGCARSRCRSTGSAGWTSRASSGCWPPTRRGSCTSPTSGATAGCVQPAAEVAALCRAAGVPLVLDAAQSLGPHRHRPRRGRRLQHLAQVAGRAAGRRRPLRAAGAGRRAHPGAARAARTCRRCGRSSPARRTWPAGSGWSSPSASTWPPDPTGCASGWRRWAGPPGSCSTASAAGGRSSRSTSRRRRRRCAPGRRRRRRHPGAAAQHHGIVTTAIGRERAPGELTGPRAADLPARRRHARRPRRPRRRPLGACRAQPRAVARFSTEARLSVGAEPVTAKPLPGA